MALRAVPDHPKFYHLKQLLGLSTYEALGILEALWHFTARFTPAGDVGKFPDEQIGAWLGWSRPESVISGLITSKWIDEDVIYRLITHDWHEHCPNYIKGEFARLKREFAKPTKKPLSSSLVPSKPPLLPLPSPSVPSKDVPPLSPKGEKTKIPNTLDQPIFIAAWETWIGYRKAKRQTMTPHTQDLQLRRCAEWGIQHAIAAIEFSIGQGYTGLFEPNRIQAKSTALKTDADRYGPNPYQTPDPKPHQEKPTDDLAY